MSSRISLRIIVAAAVTLSSTTLWAQPLAEQLPENTLIYVGWQGTARMQEYQRSYLHGIINATNPGALVTRILALVQQAAEPGEREQVKNLKLIFETLNVLWKYPSALYFGGFACFGQGQGPAIPHVALISRAGDQAARLAQRLNRAFKQAGDVPLEAEVVEGMLVIAPDIRGGGGGGESSVPALYQMLTADAEGAGPPSLAQSESFQAAMEHLRPDAVAIIYIRANQLIDLYDQCLKAHHAPRSVRENLRHAIHALGLDTIGSIIWSGGFEGRMWGERWLVEIHGQPRGLLKALVASGAEGISKRTLKLVPKNATWMRVIQLDAAELFESIVSAAEQFAPPRDPQRIDRMLQGINRMLGFNLKQDLIQTLGERWVFYTLPHSGGVLGLGLVLVKPLAEPERFKQSLQRLEAMLKHALSGGPPNRRGPSFAPQLLTMIYSDLSIQTVNMMFISPSWAVRNGRLYFALTPQAVVAAITHVRGDGPSILDDPHFQQVWNRLKPQGRNLVSIGFADLPRTAADVYQVLVLLSQVLTGATTPPGGREIRARRGVGGDEGGLAAGANRVTMLLPPYGRIKPYIKPAASASWLDEAGWHGRSISPFPGSEVFSSTLGISPASIGMMGAILVPAISRARTLARRTACQQQLRQIAAAAFAYANAHKGQLPEDLATLVVEVLKGQTQILLCPAVARNPPPPPPPDQPEELRRWVRKYADYVYVSGEIDMRMIRRPASIILAYDKLGNHGGKGMNILFADGHVQWVKMDRALRMLREQGIAVPPRKGGRAAIPPRGGRGREQQALRDAQQTPPAHGEQGQPRAWFYDPVTGKIFAAPTAKVPPVTSPWGNRAFRVHMFTCGQCGRRNRFVGYYEKLTGQAVVKLRKLKARGYFTSPLAARNLIDQGRLVSRTGKEGDWVAWGSAKGRAIRSIECPEGGEPRPCPPGA